jgi:hypothetical protein
MKYILSVISLASLLNIPLLAQEVDFSKAYLIPTPTTTSSTTEEGETPSPFAEEKLRIGGVKTIEKGNNEETIFNWVISLGFNLQTLTFHVLEAVAQNPFDAELLQQRLRGTVWRGEYKTNANLYLTELRLISIQEGLVGGEITHSTGENPEPSSFLHAQVAGTITTEYSIDEGGYGQLSWVTVSRYNEIVADISKKNEGKTGNQIVPNPAIEDVRHLIRLKRMQSLGDTKHASSRWGSHNEYRLTLAKDKFTGSVGTPPESYGDKDVLTGVGQMELTLYQSPNTSPPLPE